jgi:hypothetical protein
MLSPLEIEKRKAEFLNCREHPTGGNCGAMA